MISRAEVAAALAKAARIGLVTREAALAWEHGLRGHDSVHLASALAWSESLGETPAVATYDRELWPERSRAACPPGRRQCHDRVMV